MVKSSKFKTGDVIIEVSTGLIVRVINVDEQYYQIEFNRETYTSAGTIPTVQCRSCEGKGYVFE